ncbi:hypothetical protein [Loigolactobacillus bifermentans]|jgi:hypothetical protein|uniref:Uncharacterized protein n=1 Tax=Loigolactobacillus bifermentans DSM 20003 TaxID=1423726 RepID=A0A0R1HB60_9LACO|nr:hypothetical protein [Loigolactobacillus bifermentans]KRK40311.1 hypothetical protein FC07_GL001026 [Loigolactobacillus bifermentans DSM 20003]QGG59981.1 hypothetical protein LB003_05635 [Loigolactobacillus bifermentans]
MAHNVSQTEELIGILTDVQHHNFTGARSINPGSMLYQTIQYAAENDLIAQADIEDGTDKLVASVDLQHAQLTAQGTAFLQENQDKGTN